MNRKVSFFKISIVIFLYSCLVLGISLLSRRFAEIYTRTVSSFLRTVLAYVTSIILFSIAEVLVLVLSVLLIGLFVYTVVLIVRGSSKIKKVSINTLATLLLFLSMFFNVFGVCYLRMPLEENMDLDRQNISSEDVYLAAVYCKAQLEMCAENVEYSENGASVNPHSWSEMSSLIDEGYGVLTEKYDFLSNINIKPKKIFLSPLMTYTHISGIYVPITGEANVNTNYPQYIVTYTSGHEKAHQRGISGEDEAGFVSFLALSGSNDNYLKYCAYMTMYDHLLSSFIDNDLQMYNYFMDNTDKKIIGEMRAYHQFFEKYSDSAASDVADTVNDTYIKVMGNNEGTKSYGKATELYTAYLKVNNII